MSSDENMYAQLPEVLVDIVRDYVRPEFELAELQAAKKVKITVLGEINPEMFDHIPGSFRTSLFGIQWLMNYNNRTIIYNPEYFHAPDATWPEREINREIKQNYEKLKQKVNKNCDICDLEGTVIIDDTNVNCYRCDIIYDPRPNMYMVRCAKCSNASEPFVYYPQHSPIINLIKISNQNPKDSESITYYRGFGRDKYQFIYVGSERDYSDEYGAISISKEIKFETHSQIIEFAMQ